jgi:hypothetical protein
MMRKNQYGRTVLAELFGETQKRRSSMPKALAFFTSRTKSAEDRNLERMEALTQTWFLYCSRAMRTS